MIEINIIDYLKNKFIGTGSNEITSEDLTAIENKLNYNNNFKVAEIALFSTIDLIAKTLSKCRFCTIENGKEVEKAEFYAWNYRPNIHQTKTEFITQVISRLLFKNEVLIFETFDGQRLVAENFNKETKALYDDVFTNVYARNWSFDNKFLSRDVIYLKYNSVAIQNLLDQMCFEYEKMMSLAKKKYKRSMSQKAIVDVSAAATNTKDFTKRFNQMLNEDFAAYFGEGDVVLPVYDGISVRDTSPSENGKAKNSDIGDIDKLRESIEKIVEKTFHINDRDEFIANSIDPLAHMLEEAITVKCYGEKRRLKGNYMHIDTTYAKHYDPITSADSIYKSIGSRIINPAQAQRYCNMVPDSDKSAQTYYMTKNNQTADMAVTEGGENNA